MLTYHSQLDNVLKMGKPCRCIACENPCKFGSGAFVEGQVQKLAGFLGLTEEETKEKYLEPITKLNTTLHRPKLEREEGKPYGKCVFFDEGKGCKIHPVKPMECNVAMGCKDYGSELITWFNLRYYLNPNDPESLRQFKTYVEAGGMLLPGAELENFIDEKTRKELEAFEDIKKSRDKDWEEVLDIKKFKKQEEGKNG